MPASEDRGLRRFLASSLAVHGVGIVLLVGILARLPVPVERPLRVRIMNSSAPQAAPPAAPAAPSATPAPGLVRPADEPPELVEAPKPRVEEAPRSKRFAGLHDRRGGPGARDAPDSKIAGKTGPRPQGSLRGEEVVRPPAAPPRDVPPAKTPPPSPSAPPAAQETKVARADPLPAGRPSIISPAPPAAASPAPAVPPSATDAGRASPGAAAPPQAPPAAPPRPARSLRDQVAGLSTDYRPPVDDPGTGGDPSGRGDPGLETFRFKYATWGLAVKRDIERAWKVPEFGISSLAIVRFIVLPDGKVRDLQLDKSSGLSSLDQAATNAITNAAPFRPFPARMSEEHPGGIEITVNFYYREGRGVLHWE